VLFPYSSASADKRYSLAIMSKWSVHAALLLLASLGAHAAIAETTLSGRFEYRTDPESIDVIGRQVCFFPSEPSVRRVPRPAGDKRLPWFCFSNSKAAAKMLGFRLKAPPKSCGIRGNATVTVSNYVLYTKEGDGNDIATLKSVVRKARSEQLSCNQ